MAEYVFEEYLSGVYSGPPVWRVVVERYGQNADYPYRQDKSETHVFPSHWGLAA